ncbi:TNF receptor-associated factor family protein [Ananas comosus]|uniref:TNF receptor-associated factor family protein n=1 Tax=Ananas comosus TaxID=4615 RepID=A0A199UFM1_ANACO|nr:TNF receptor-associated factor family protein [Ananas comosus]
MDQPVSDSGPVKGECMDQPVSDSGPVKGECMDQPVSDSGPVKGECMDQPVSDSGPVKGECMDQPVSDSEPVKGECMDQPVSDSGPVKGECMDQPVSDSEPVKGECMDQPVSDSGLVKGECLPFSCDYCDRELVHKIAQVLLPGLATACVDNTTGGLFKSPSSVAIDLRKEMVDYLTQRSETFIAETVVPQEGAQAPTEETSDDPVEIISEFLDNFSSSKRNFFSRVSNWLLSESREDKIDDFVQEMEMDEFWSIDRRETVSEVLLRNVDLKSAFHCVMKFGSEHELVAHKNACCFRPMDCPNEGCLAKFSAEHMEKHDSACPFKVLSCEQNCSQSLMRREMDRHCITVCPMRLINCPFNQAGCESTIPQCTLKEHCSQYLQSHILYVLRTIHKQGVSEEELKQKAELLEKVKERKFARKKTKVQWERI